MFEIVTILGLIYLLYRIRFFYKEDSLFSKLAMWKYSGGWRSKNEE